MRTRLACSSARASAKAGSRSTNASIANMPASALRDTGTGVVSGGPTPDARSSRAGSSSPRAVARRTVNANAAGNTFASVSSDRFL